MGILTRDECLEVLRRHQREVGVGRVAMIDGERPVVFPVNYVMNGRRVAFRCSPGTKFAAAERGAPVAFEIDEVDLDLHNGWSVIVHGHVRFARPDELPVLEQQELPLFRTTDAPHWVIIDPEEVSGRRVPRVLDFVW